MIKEQVKDFTATSEKRTQTPDTRSPPDFAVRMALDPLPIFKSASRKLALRVFGESDVHVLDGHITGITCDTFLLLFIGKAGLAGIWLRTGRQIEQKGGSRTEAGAWYELTWFELVSYANGACGSRNESIKSDGNEWEW